MRTISVVTVGRSDWGIYLPILSEIQKDAELKLNLIVTGAHLAPCFGTTVDAIESSGFCVDERVEMLLGNDSPEAIAKSMGLGMLGFAQVYQRVKPDWLLVLGDRFEMHAAASAAVPFKMPIAHIHGGEVTNGAIDDSFRHAITKYSHLHFVSTECHRQRVIQLGEEPWRVTVSGAPGLDNLHSMSLLTIADLENHLQISFEQLPLLVTFHPVTRQYEQTAGHAAQLLQALAEFEMPIIITKPNADTSGQQIIRQIEEFAQRPHVRLVDSLGTQVFFSLMACSAAMVGNSSSGIIEAASFGLPAVNVGIRQHGRARSSNVIDVDCERSQIVEAIHLALSTEFRSKLAGMQNVYGNGQAAASIVRRLSTEPINQRLLLKQFFDLTERQVPVSAAS